MTLSTQHIYLIPYKLTEEIVLFFVFVVQVYYRRVKDTVVAIGSEIIGAPRLVAIGVKKKIGEYKEQAAKAVKIVRAKVKAIFNVAHFDSFKTFFAFWSAILSTNFKVRRLSVFNVTYTKPDFVIYSNLLAPPIL